MLVLQLFSCLFVIVSVTVSLVPQVCSSMALIDR
uniref:Uncharacterized protein n=1 Tax=Oryza glumipatula TaxID=40148 RepID=A0A0E0AJ69_9ORYZ